MKKLLFIIIILSFCLLLVGCIFMHPQPSPTVTPIITPMPTPILTPIQTATIAPTFTPSPMITIQPTPTSTPVISILKYNIDPVGIGDASCIFQSGSMVIEGEAISITAPIIQGYKFISWAGYGMPTETYVLNPTISFIMPSNDIDITAYYFPE